MTAAAEPAAPAADGAAYQAGSPAQATILEVEDLQVSFGGVAALRGVSMHVGGRSVVAVVGPNGAGKTTLLNAISGIAQSKLTGRIRFNGTDIAGRSAARIGTLGIGRSYQHPPILEAETVLENLLLGAHLRLGYSISAQVFRPRHVARREKVEHEAGLALLELLGLRQVAHKRAGSLPYGARKTLDIARAVFSEPVLLMLDEPTSGLDTGEQQVIIRLIRRLRDERAMSIVLIEHHMEVVRACADHAVGLQAGSVLVAGTVESVLGSGVFREALIGTSEATGGQEAEA